MGKRLLIDLDKCDRCDRCGVSCSYFYRSRPEDHGVFALRERATYSLICRRCEQPSCILACPFDALARNTLGVLERHAMRCVSCKLCVHACPFGTIYPDMVSFYVTPCDYCLMGQGEEPPCAVTCGEGAIEYCDVDPGDQGIHVVDEHLAARSRRWAKREEAHRR